MACQPDAEESQDASCQTDSAVENSITEEVVCAEDLDIPMGAQSPPRASPASSQPVAEDGGATASGPKDQLVPARYPQRQRRPPNKYRAARIAPIGQAITACLAKAVLRLASERSPNKDVNPMTINK